MKQQQPKHIRYHYPKFILLVTVLLAQSTAVAGKSLARIAGKLGSQAIAQEPKPTDLGALTPGPFTEHELSGGNSHSYRVRLNSKQFLKVLVNQKGLDVVVLLFAPDGIKLSEVDNTGGTETVFAIAENAGDYRVEVRTSDKEAKPGKYEIGIAELRETVPKDQKATAAEKLLEEGIQLRNTRTEKSRRAAIKKFEEALPLWRDAGDVRGQALTLNELGVVSSNLSDPQKAVEYYSQSVPLAQVAGDKVSQATTLTNMGTAYWRLGETQKALESHNQALPLAREAGDAQIEALILINTGAVYWSLGQPRDSLNYYNQSIGILQALGARRLEAVTLNNIATAYQQIGDLEKALKILTQAITVRRAMEDGPGEAAALNNLGLLHIQLGDFPEALNYYTQALKIRRDGGDRQLIATNLQGISSVYVRMGDMASALTYAEEALGLAREVADPLLQAYVLDTIGRIHHLSGEPAKAMEQFDQSLKLRRKVADRYGETYALSNLANSYLAAGDTAKALEYYHEALEISRRIGDRLGSASILYGSARAHSKTGDKPAALVEIEDALAIIESTRLGVPSQDFRSTFLASYRDFFQFYIDLLMQMHQAAPAAGNDVKALAASERARARGLLELLAEAKIDVRQGVADDLKQREQDLQARISWVQSQLIQANSQSKPDPVRITSLESEFKKTENERAQVEIETRQKHPRYASLKYPSPLALQAIQRALDEKTVLLEYALGKDGSFLFAISKNDFVAARLPAAGLLNNQIVTLRDAVANRPDRMTVSNYLLGARSLYQELVQPANRLLSGKQSLIIVPDGILHYLPFELLLKSDAGRQAQLDLHELPYLIKDYAISYAPSATILANLQKAGPPPVKRKTFLAYGDPLYPKSDFERATPIRSAVTGAFAGGKPWELQPLPESRNEVERIARLYPRDEVGVFLGDQASEENVKAGHGPGHFRYVHFAVHGLLNETKPQFSGLVMRLPPSGDATAAKQNDPAIISTSGKTETASAPRKVQAEDGLLQVYEIFNLKLDADLVVLSACESGLGKETKGEGLVGLTQAFFYAGTPSLAVSLWKVQDKSTAALMVRFYQHLNNPSLNKAQALRRAQLEMIRAGEFSHPYYWAGFVLIGQP